MSDTADHLKLDVHEGVGTVTLNRPDRMNAVNWDLASDVVTLLREIRENDEIRTVVLTGTAGNFCAGGDADFISGEGDRPLPGMSEPGRRMAREQRKTPGGPFAGVTRGILQVDKPVIAAIQGVCVGAGFAYALACDRRFADPTARMSAIFVKRGFSPDCGITYFLPRIVNLPTALMLVETGKMVPADEAAQMGLVDELVEEGKALEAATAYAAKLASGPSVAIDLARRFIYRSICSDFEDILDYECVVGTMTASTADAKEGVTSFLERRKPEFKGY